MTAKDTGGPAFPEKRRVMRAGYSTDEFYPVSGMTLRDWFAGKYIEGCAADPNASWDNDDIIMHHATHAYKVADAMLEARNK